MPTYEYKCKECSDLFEQFQSIKDEPLVTCSKCGGGLKRLIGNGGGVIFKGSGFYVNDYKKNASSAPSPGCGGCSASPGGCPAASGSE